jgi:hypothetical protein
MSGPSITNNGNKENNRNVGNITGGHKKFIGGNQSLLGKVLKFLPEKRSINFLKH